MRQVVRIIGKTMRIVVVVVMVEVTLRLMLRVVLKIVLIELVVHLFQVMQPGIGHMLVPFQQQTLRLLGRHRVLQILTYFRVWRKKHG